MCICVHVLGRLQDLARELHAVNQALLHAQLAGFVRYQLVCGQISATFVQFIFDKKREMITLSHSKPATCTDPNDCAGLYRWSKVRGPPVSNGSFAIPSHQFFIRLLGRTSSDALHDPHLPAGWAHDSCH